jgi:hypothetical protein
MRDAPAVEMPLRQLQRHATPAIPGIQELDTKLLDEGMWHHAEEF